MSPTAKVKVISLGLIMILIPIAYLFVLNQIVPHPGLKFYAGWIDDSFQTSVWRLAYDKPVGANISSENGTLKIYASGNLSVNTIVSAQRWSGLDFNLTTYRYLKVSVKTSGLDVAARIVIWTDTDQGHVLLLKTYNDEEWHTEIIDVVFFLEISSVYSSQLIMIELSWQQVNEGSSSTASYAHLSFNNLENV
jgi:hypothetical protein